MGYITKLKKKKEKKKEEEEKNTSLESGPYQKSFK
jgi:ribosomal protein S17E